MTTVHRIFTYDGLRISIEAADSRHLGWLEEFLTPAFGVAAAGAADVTVKFLEDSERFERLLAGGPLPDAPEVDVFALDQQVLRFPLWRQSSADVTLFDERFQAFYDVSADRRSVRIVVREGQIRCRTPLMRIVRELAMNYTQRAGNLLLHASGFAIHGHGVILAGPTAAGKTTLLLQMLRHPYARYISNDRVRVSMASPVPTLHGMPTIVTVRPPTIAMFPELGARLATRSYNHRLALAEVLAQPSAPTLPWSDGRIGLSPAQLCELAGVEAIAECAATALLFPRITGEAGHATLHKLPPPAAAARLLGALFGVRSWKKTSDVFWPPGAPPPPSEESLMALCGRFAESVPCFECRLGVDAYAAPANAALLEDVLR